MRKLTLQVNLISELTPINNNDDSRDDDDDDDDD